MKMARLIAVTIVPLCISLIGGCAGNDVPPAPTPPVPPAPEPAPTPAPEPAQLPTTRCCEGYTLLSPVGPGSHGIFVNMNGEIVKELELVDLCKMLPCGSILGTKRVRTGKDDPLAPSPEPPGGAPPGAPSPGGPPPGGPPGGTPWFDAIEFVQVSWDGVEEWSTCCWDDDGTGVMMSRQHHDFQREGNPVGYYAPGQECLKQGKTLLLAHKNKVVPKISDKELVDDVIYEVDENGKLTGFEWHAADHFEEFGFDQSARDAICNNPHFEPEKERGDWLHLNTLSVLGQNHWFDETGDERFNPENIMICSRSANFVAIISRGTGDVVWKVGPDFVTGTPEYNLGQFVGSHHAHMIPKGLPGEGNILIFDNGGNSGYGGPTDFPRYTRQYSRVVELNPVTLEVAWQYGAESGDEFFFSHNISSAQRLPNGNTLITDGANGRVFEVTPEKEIVWDIMCPLKGPQGPARVYRAYRVPPEWVPGNPEGYTEWATLYE